jgi:hypothetical protein
MRVVARHLRIRFGPRRGAGVRRPTIKARSLRAEIRHPGAACHLGADSGGGNAVVHGQNSIFGRVIHRRLRGAPGGSPRRLLNNSGPTIRAGCREPALSEVEGCGISRRLCCMGWRLGGIPKRQARKLRQESRVLLGPAECVVAAFLERTPPHRVPARGVS